MTLRHHNRSTVLALALLALVVVMLLSACFGPSLPRIEAPPSPGSGQDIGKPLASDASPADYNARIAALSGLLAEANAGKLQAQHDAKQAELAAWRTWTRWISALVIPLAIAAGALSLWFGFAGMGLPIAGAAIAAAVSLQLWAEAQAFLLPALAVICGIGLIVGAIAFLRRDRAAVLMARVGDAIEDGRTATEVTAAKIEAEAAQLAAGVFRVVQKSRGKPVVPKSARGAA